MLKTSLFALGLLALTSCASVKSRLPVPKQTAITVLANAQQERVFKSYLARAKRLNLVSHKVLAANADLCEKTRLDVGIVLHARKSYPKALRKGAAKVLGAGKTPSVLFVRDQENPAQFSKISPGDTIVNGAGKAVDLDDKSVQDGLMRGVLKFKHKGQIQNLRVQTKSICDYPVRLKFSNAVNAYANGRAITVTTGMMNFVKSDEELALVLGHELAHNTMHHVRKSIWNTLVSLNAHRFTRRFEAEADYVGLYYMARAGFDLKNVENFWQRLGVYAPNTIVKAKTHPISPERALAIVLTRDEINTKRANDAPLLPNYKDKTKAQKPDQDK